MPSRYAIVAIMAFWLATTGWLFFRDVWPRLQSDEPPPFGLHLADETPVRMKMRSRWSIRDDKHDRDIGFAWSYTDYDRHDDTFQLQGRLRFISQDHQVIRPPAYFPGFPRNPPLLEDHEMPVQCSGHYRVTRDGELRELMLEIQTLAKQDSVLADITPSIHADIRGHVQQEYFIPEWWYNQGPSDKQRNVPLEPIQVSKRGSVLNALQPVPRLMELYVGQRWQVPVIDPLTAARDEQHAPSFEILDARVSAGVLNWKERDVVCYLVDYTGTRTKMRTWVRQSDDLVLEQEVFLPGYHFWIRRSTN